MTIAVPKRDVKTTLMYWKPVPGNKVVAEFTKPGPVHEDGVALMDKGHSPASVTIHDVRGRESEFSLERNGFQYVVDQAPDFSHCHTAEEISAVLVPAAEKLVQELLGATKTHVIAHRVRSKSTNDTHRGDPLAPALSVHADFTAEGARHLLEELFPDATERSTLLKGRVYLMNVWRPLRPVFRDPLAILDWSSVDASKEWIAYRYILPDGWYELAHISRSESHKWWYLSQQTPDEPLVFVQYDQRRDGEGGMTMAHSAFVDPESQDGEARESIEVKMFAFVPEA